MSLGKTALLGLDDLVADDGSRCIVRSHFVEHQVLDCPVDLLATEHAVVKGSGHGLGDQLKNVEVGQFGSGKQRSALSLKIIKFK